MKRLLSNSKASVTQSILIKLRVILFQIPSGIGDLFIWLNPFFSNHGPLKLFSPYS